MFSKELEALIDATLADGVLEENEKAVLARRAEKEGVDLAELEVYINSILQKRQQELNKQHAVEEKEFIKQKKEAFGRVCPNCGRPVPPLTLKCECGFEFTSQNTLSSVQLLANKIEEISKSKINKSDMDESREMLMGDSAEEKQIRDAISMFPVPNTKEDIIEFLALAIPNSKKSGNIITRILARIPMYGPMLGGAGIIQQNKRAEVWQAKCEQVLIKAHTLRGDKEFLQQLDYYENLLNKK